MNENKLLVDNNDIITLNNEKVLLECKTNILNVNVNGNVIINEIIDGYENILININISNNSSLIYNRFCNNVSGKCIIKTIGDESRVSINNSLVSNEEYCLTIDSEISNDNNSNIINISAVSINSSKITIDATGIIEENTKNNNYSENIKILNLNELEHTILPNLVVKTDDVIAVHNATIANVSEKELYYLNSKGISLEESIKLIKNGFLLKKLDINKNELERIKEILNS